MSIILEPHFPRYGLITLSAQYSNRLDAIWLIIGDWLLLLLLSHVVFHHLRLGDHSLQFLHLSVKPHFEFLTEAELIIVLFYISFLLLRPLWALLPPGVLFVFL